MLKVEIDEPKEFICETYYYLINGKKYYRVTQVKAVLNQVGLNNWRVIKGKAESSKIMKARQNFGTKIHKLFELTLQGHKVNRDNYKDEEVIQDLDLMDELIKDCNLDASSIEQHLWSEKYQVAGTVDYIGGYASSDKYLKKKIKGKFINTSNVIGDWKTSNAIYEDYWLQLSAYIFIFEEMTGEKLAGAFIAQFRDGKLHIEEKTYDELKPYFEIFKHCIKCFEYQRKEGNIWGDNSDTSL
jgi:hypothetical protein